jgi:hypothetical protein
VPERHFAQTRRSIVQLDSTHACIKQRISGARYRERVYVIFVVVGITQHIDQCVQ